MKPPDRAKKIVTWSLLGSCLLLTPGAWPLAATLRWTGAGATALWSDPNNWTAARAPLDGDDLDFAGAAPGFNSVLDLSRTFASLAFGADARAFALHVQGSGAMLAFDGVGIRNLTAGSGPIRQQFFADAGTAGGSIVFTRNAGINLGDSGNFRPVDLTAQGGSATAAVGGHIVFQDNAATSGSSFDALRAEGASAAGATGGEIVFRNNAVATKSSSVTVTGGTATGAAGAQASFFDSARIDGALNVLAGAGGGAGARATFSGQASASVFVGIANQGARAAGSGAEAVTRFRDDATLAGSVSNEAGQGTGFNGGRLEFRDRASHDSRGIDPTLGRVQIINGGATASGAGSGGTVFFDDAAVRGTRLLLTNAVQAEGAEPGSVGGSTEFRDRSRAGQATLVNQGATTDGAGTAGGRTVFLDRASAESADITSQGGAALNAPGGSTQFADSATAGAATLRNQGARVAGAFSGTVDFSGNASAGSATIVNAAGEAPGSLGGAARFSGQAVAGTAFISNEAPFGSGGGAAGIAVFSGDASAQAATIDNAGGFFTTDNAVTVFHDRSVAADARITNFGGRASGAFGGGTSFDGTASAGAASLVLTGGGVARALGGFVGLTADASAGSAVFDLRAGSVASAVGSRVYFFDRASAGSARFSVQGSRIDSVLGPEAAAVSFADTSSAADATFTVGGNLFAGGGSGAVRFTGSSTAARAVLTLAAGQTRGGALAFEGDDATQPASAGDARISNQGSSSTAPRGTAIGGITTFAANSTAARATITNQAGFGAGLTNFFAASGAGDASVVNLGGLAGEDGGSTQFNNSASAQRASIVNQAGARGASGFDAAGSTRFVNQASAGSAHITAEGSGSASALGGLVVFTGTADPARATLVAEGGTNGGTGGRIVFSDLTNASQVRVVLNAGAGPGSGGSLDISGLSAGVQGIAIGSLEGGGSVNLGGKNLRVWGSGANAVFSGVLQDGGSGGSLGVAGGSTLTLSGANSYGGGTRIGDGATPGSGKLVVTNLSGSATGSGPVAVERGGTLAGSGFIAGPVVLRDGGSIAPGDPVTLTLQDSLTWDGGGVLRLVVGADAAGSDHVNVHRLVRGASGAFLIELIDFGSVAGTVYDLISFDQQSGFQASDFSFSGVAGTFSLHSGALEFTTTAVPEPGTAVLCLGGLWVVWAARRTFKPRAAS